MADHVSVRKRSEIMRAVPGKDTSPEMALRRWLHARGFRYRLHGRSLPGTPDLVFASRSAVVFVHGCFWHGHNCSKGRHPKSNVAFWKDKVATNQARDRRSLKALRRIGWRCRVVWQCQLKDIDRAGENVVAFLAKPAVAKRYRI